MPNFNFLPQKFDFITVNHDKLSMKAKVGVANLVVSTVHTERILTETHTSTGRHALKLNITPKIRLGEAQYTGRNFLEVA